MKVWINTLFVCLIFLLPNVQAVEVERLYEVEVIAKSEQEADKVAAIKLAMQRLLMRILAGNEIFNDATVASVLNNAENYISEYQFSLAAGEQKSARLMRVLFDEEKIVSTFRPGKIGLWNEIRPRTLMWLVVERQGKQQFFDPDTMPDIERVLKKASKQKKIPVLFPMQDLKEKRVLSISDVLSAYSEHLLEVSVRYEVVSTLAGKLVQQGACWTAEWTLYFDAKIEQWRSPCASIDQATLLGFQGVYDRLSKYYAATPERKEVAAVMMKISGIDKVSEIMQVTEYLDALPMIKTVTWLAAKEGYNFYRVFYQGARKNLNNRLATDHVLSVESFLNQSADEVKYRFLNK